MARPATNRLVMVVAVMSVVTAARAHTPNTVGRYLGIGWSDGYHSPTTCLPKGHAIIPVMTTAPIAPAPAIPWWKIPATPEPISAPAPQAAPTSSSAGQSLFRRPGEGSSVTALNAPQH